MDELNLAVTWLAFVGIVALQYVSYWVNQSRFKKWPTVVGTITVSELIDHNTLVRTHNSGSELKRVYRARIAYRYSVGGKYYTSEKAVLRPLEIFPDRNYESVLGGKYDVGDQARVRYNPQYPQLAYLEIAPVSLESRVIFGAALVVGVLVVLMIWLRRTGFF